jgi:hypothetical protein
MQSSFERDLSQAMQKYVECQNVFYGFSFSHPEIRFAGIISACLTSGVMEPEDLLNWVHRRLMNVGRHFFESACRRNEPYADHMLGAEYIAYAAKHGELNEDELRTLESKLDHGMTLDSYYKEFASTLKSDTYNMISVVRT